MTFYAGAIILTELMMVAMTLHVLYYSGFTKLQKTWFLLTFGSIMLCAGAEFAVHCGYYNPKFAVPLTVLTVLQFSVAPALGVLFTGALGLEKQGRIAVAYLCVNLVIETVAAPFGWIFYFNEAGYFRGDGFMVYEAFYLVSLVYLVVCMVLIGKKFHNRDVRTIIMILVVLVAGILPMTLYKLNITYIAIAIGACLCYIYYNDLVQQDIQAELVANQQQMSRMQSHIISGLSNLIENRDIETGEHVVRTGIYVRTLAECAARDGVYANELDAHFIDKMQLLAPMHDIGKVVVSDSILKKPGRLTPAEFEIMKKHAAAGGAVVREVLGGVADEEYISFAADIATYHHEWWNGLGYPSGLAGAEIPLCARIMAIADVFDALVSERCYKAPIDREAAFAVIRAEAGTHFDPRLVEVFLRHKDEFN